MTEYATIEDARSFNDPDATYKAALNDPTVFEALCSDPETIRLLIDVFTMKVEHLETQLKNRRTRLDFELMGMSEFETSRREAEHAEWEGKVRALLRSTQFHLNQTLRRARLLWDDPIKVLKEIDDLLTSSMSDADVLDAISNLVGNAMEEIEVQ